MILTWWKVQNLQAATVVKNPGGEESILAQQQPKRRIVRCCRWHSKRLPCPSRPKSRTTAVGLLGHTPESPRAGFFWPKQATPLLADELVSQELDADPVIGILTLESMTPDVEAHELLEQLGSQPLEGRQCCLGRLPG